MNKEIMIGNHKISEDSPTFVIAEMSANHLMDFDRAVAIMQAAKDAGANAIKIQTYTPENDVIRAAAAQDYERFYRSEVQLRRLRRDPPFADQLMVTVTGPEESAVRRAIRETFSLTDAEADELHRHLWIYVHGLCTLIVTGVNDIPDTEAAHLLGEFSCSHFFFISYPARRYTRRAPRRQPSCPERWRSGRRAARAAQ